MTFAPLLSAPAVIQIHAAAALLALVLGIVVLWRRKGTVPHRWTGRVWVALMVITSVSALLIPTSFGADAPFLTLGRFGPIHLLSLFTLYTCVDAIRAIRAGRVRHHALAMKTMFLAGLVGAGLFTLAPGRIMGAIFIGW